MTVFLIFLLGACAGSFLNICIYRIPLGRRIFARSHCAACGVLVPWWRNIPLFSWVFLRGTAACCGTKIDTRYPVVETLTAILFTVLWLCYPLVLSVIYMGFAAGLIIAACVDLDHFYIPNRVSLGCCLAGVALSAIYPPLQGAVTWTDGLLRSVAGLLAGGGFLWFAGYAGKLVLRREAMGMGDVKLLGGLGAMLGWQSVIFILVISSVLGSLVGMGLVIVRGKSKKTPIPYGPHLAAAAVLWVLGGNRLFYWLVTQSF